MPRIVPETESSNWSSSTQRELPLFEHVDLTNTYLQRMLAYKEIKAFQTNSMGMLKDNYHLPVIPRYFMDFRRPGVRCNDKPTQMMIDDIPDPIERYVSP